MPSIERLCRVRRAVAACTIWLHSPRARRYRNCCRCSVLRRLPFRLAHGAQRMGSVDLSAGAGSRNCRTGHDGRQGGKEVQSRRYCGDRRHRGLVPPLCSVHKGEEHFCAEGATLTYADKDRVDGSITMGGYSSNYVVDERFAHTVPAHLDLAAVAPCSAPASRPIRRCGIGKWDRARRLESSAWADLATWALSSRMPLARTPCS